jgi:hypothetical protein
MRTATQERRKKQQVRAFPFVTAPGSGVILWWYLIITRINRVSIWAEGGIPQDTSGSVGEVRGPESGVGVDTQYTVDG